MQKTIKAKQKEIKKLWRYLSHLKEGGEAWERTIKRLEELKQQVL